MLAIIERNENKGTYRYWYKYFKALGLSERKAILKAFELIKEGR